MGFFAIVLSLRAATQPLGGMLSHRNFSEAARRRNPSAVLAFLAPFEYARKQPKLGAFFKHASGIADGDLRDCARHVVHRGRVTPP
jgi:hypothetical protein